MRSAQARRRALTESESIMSGILDTWPTITWSKCGEARGNSSSYNVFREIWAKFVSLPNGCRDRRRGTRSQVCVAAVIQIQLQCGLPQHAIKDNINPTLESFQNFENIFINVTEQRYHLLSTTPVHWLWSRLTDDGLVQQIRANGSWCRRKSIW